MAPARRPRLRVASRAAMVRLAVLLALLALGVVAAWFAMIRMPGRSHEGPLPPLSPQEQAVAAALRADVETLAGAPIGPRSVLRPRALAAAADFLEHRLAGFGYAVQRERYDVGGVACANIVAERRGAGAAEQIVVVGAHYDSVVADGIACPGANDNASGVAATLAIAETFAGRAPRRTVRFVFFVNEEPPWYATDDMGSLVHARASRARGDDIVAMLSLETIGCYLDEPGTQRYPRAVAWAYPDRGDFIAFVGNVGSRGLVRDVVRSFRSHTAFPSQGGALPGWIEGVGWSDHWSFWQCGYPGMMVTDTAPYRDRAYHTEQDTPDRLDYERMARVVKGVERVVVELAGE